MRIFGLTVMVLSLLIVSQAVAQQPSGRKTREREQRAPEPIATTPEMWIYQQEMRRYEDPKTAIRRRAEFYAQQRQRRLAAMKWFGLSNARPIANPTPFGSMYSPAWVSNTGRPFGWAGSSQGVPYPVDRD